MTTDNKAPDCSGCKHSGTHPRVAFCCNDRARYMFQADERERGQCGPSAKYYEPKEQQP